MLLVIGLTALVTLNYWFLVRRFPQGGGDAEAAGRQEAPVCGPVVGQGSGCPWLAATMAYTSVRVSSTDNAA